MSDTVKLIIEIPKETYKTITADKYAIYDKMYYSIKKGIPLDDVKANYISLDDVMSVFDDFMCGEVDEDETATFLEMLKDKAESED